jgi:alkylation response protein AidB-like acyl-CoA dehydrogenase
MELTFSQEQQMLRDTVRGMLAAHSPVEVVRKMEDDPIGYPADLWKKLAELGLLGLTLPERYGGADLTTLDAAILYEEMGRALAPSPHFVSAVLSAGVIAAAGSQAQRDEWLPKIASGEAIITPAWLEPQGGYGPAGVRLVAADDGKQVRLTGTKRHVAFARAATRLLVLARTGKGERDVDLFLVDPKDARVGLLQQHTMASDTQYQATFDEVAVAKSERIGPVGSGWTTWDGVMHDGIILLAAQAIGGAERALEMTVDYAKLRKQFDKPLGAFQAIAHYLADAVTQVDGGKTLVYEAAWARSTGRPVDRLAPMAKLFACQTFRDVTAMAEQVHGGLGFTVEFDIQLYFRRAKQLQLSWWDSRYLEELVAASVLDVA